MIRKAEEFIKNSANPVQIIGVGKKGFNYFGKRKYNVVKTLSVPSAGARLEAWRLIDSAPRMAVKIARLSSLSTFSQFAM